MRILILRIFIGWWFIPAVWIIVFPIIYLIAGFAAAIDTLEMLTKTAWHGDE